MLDPARIRESIRNRQLVREQSPMRGRELIGYLTLCSLIALPAVFVLWQQNAYVRTRFEIESLRKEKLALQERYRCLRIETGTLESLGRIEDEARKNGLVPRDQAFPAFIFSGTGSGALAAAEGSKRSMAADAAMVLRTPVPNGLVNIIPVGRESDRLVDPQTSTRGPSLPRAFPNASSPDPRAQQALLRRSASRRPVMGPSPTAGGSVAARGKKPRRPSRIADVQDAAALDLSSGLSPGPAPSEARDPVREARP